MRLTRYPLLLAGLVLFAARPSLAQTISPDNIGPHSCRPPAVETTFQPFASWTPGTWWTALQRQLQNVALRWTPSRELHAARPGAYPQTFAFRRHED